MKLITESDMKQIIKTGDGIVGGELFLSEDCMLTPSAQAIAIDFKLKLKQNGKVDGGWIKNIRGESGKGKRPEAGKPCAGKSESGKDGAGTDRTGKPDHMTQLNAMTLVAKDNARIRLRGEIDLLIAELLKVQMRAAGLSQQLVEDLEDVYRFIGKISRAEVRDEPFEVAEVIGLDYCKVREISHHPQQYFSRGHLFDISYRDGELTVLLNGLRALSRRCELTFYEAFKEADGTVSRPDLMEAYNRLSSILYILCLRAVSGQYEVQS